MTLTMIIAIIAAMLFGVFCALCLYSIFKNQKDIEKNESRMKGIEDQLGSVKELINDRTDKLESRINEQPIYNVCTDVIDVNPSYPYDRPAEGTEGTINISDLMNDDFEDILLDDSGGMQHENNLEGDEVLSAFMNSFKAFENEVIGGGTAEIAATEKPAVEATLSDRTVMETADTTQIRITADPIQTQVPEDLIPARVPEMTAPIEPERLNIPEKTAMESRNFRHHEEHDVGKSGKKYTVSELEQLIR